MSKIHIIPLIQSLNLSEELANQYHAAFEYNDFYHPDILDDKNNINQIIQTYKHSDRNRSEDTLHGAFLDVTIHSADSLIRKVSEQRIIQSLEIASQLDCKAVVFHTNYISNFTLPSYTNGWINSNVDFFHKIAETYFPLNIYMENMFDTTPYLLRSLAEKMSDCKNFGVCLDVAHAHLSDFPMEKWIDTLSPYIRHMHLNDNTGDMDSHNAIGDGTINWKLFSEKMNSSSIHPSILLELSTIEKQRDSLQYMQSNQIFPFSPLKNGHTTV